MNRTRQVSLKALTAIAALAAATITVHAYDIPTGGWDYTYDGASAAYGTAGAFDSLDGTWNRGAPGDSDQWDGSGLGGTYSSANKPGGVETGTDGSTTFLRIQDPGDPRNSTLGWVDPSNRKIAFGHDLAAQGYGNSFIDNGVTLNFRLRVPTSGMDDLWTRNVPAATVAYPAAGDGVTYFGEGLGGVSVKQFGAGGVTIGFSLMTSFDQSYIEGLGGTAVPGLMITDGGGGEFVQVPIADPTAWHDIWVTIQAGGTKTHQVSVYVDNSLVPTTLDITAGDNQNDYSAYNWLGMGHGTTGSPGLGSGAEDVDFLSIKAGVWTPIPEPSVVSLALLGLLGLAARFRSCRRS